MSKLQFSGYRLQPMGSHPRIADKRATYDLFGPVNKLWSANYDRAMTAFVACLREFGEHARRKDLAEGGVGAGGTGVPELSVWRGARSSC